MAVREIGVMQDVLKSRTLKYKNNTVRRIQTDFHVDLAGFFHFSSYSTTQAVITVDDNDDS
jgi:hypothetical protein